MRIESVTAEAFGPLVGKTLKLAPGLTVIVGRNESAKSSWHAAIYAGLCGRRRGRGASNLTDRRFADLHRPWDSDAWAAAVDVVLDDGRRIQIRQDLAGKIDSRALDLVLGRDVSNEIMNDGVPDGARWLGLDRESFLATACINQAALKEVLESAAALQEYLGRAAASATADVTAAHALGLLDDFQKEHVGRLAANAVRPLKRAIDGRQSAKTARDSAGLAHAAYVELVVAAEQTRGIAEAASRQVEAAVQKEGTVDQFVAASREAHRAQEDAAQDRQRRDASASALEARSQILEQVVQLDVEFGGQPPAGLAEAEVVADVVTGALARWGAAPAPQPLEGESTQSLREDLEQVPELPKGDTQPDQSVVREYADVVAARNQLSVHTLRRPEALGDAPDLDLAAAISATPAVVRSLAVDVAAADAFTIAPPAEIQRLGQAAIDTRAHATKMRDTAEEAASRHGATAGPRRSSNSKIAWISGAVLAVGAVVAFAVGQPVIATAAAVLAVLTVVAGQVVARRNPGGGNAASINQTPASHWDAASKAERQAIQAEEVYKTAAANAAAHQSVRMEVEARCAARGLPADAGRLRQLAEVVDVWRGQQAEQERWNMEHEDAVRSVVTHEERTRAALLEREPGVLDQQRPVDDMVEVYEASCRQRSAQATAAGRRAALEERISQRETAESEFARSFDRRRAAAAAVMTAAVAAGLTEPDAGSDDSVRPAEALVAGLEVWQQERVAKVGVLDEARGRWQRLQVLLNGSTIDQLRHGVAAAATSHEALVTIVEAREQAATLAEARRFECAQVAGVEAGPVADVQSAEAALEATRHALGQLRVAAQDASAAAERGESVKSERAAGLLSVAEAEETLAAANTEVGRVQELAETLKLTTEFLQRAQERVHRDIAPILTATLTQWLPLVTDGRYTEALIDPATLHIQVRATGGAWRHADRLSVGTAEQIYLLLRISLAQHLAVTGECCPLLLDDVTVQADPVRTVQILELLRSVAEHRQVILFAQEASVEEWAKSQLNGERHSVITLDQVAIV